jgi:hypothetical protein
MGFHSIHWFKILCFFFLVWVPETEEPSWISHNQFACIFRDFKSCDWYWWEIILFKGPRVKCVSFLDLWLPNFYISILIPENNFNFIWMQNSTIYLDSSIIIFSLKSFSFEIKCFKCTILTGRKKPFVVFLKVHSNYVPSMPVKSTFLIWVSKIINLHMSICTRS